MDNLRRVETSSIAEALCERIRNKKAKVAVFGLGYVGLPFAVEKGKVGFDVFGIDRNPKRVAAVNAGRNYIGDVKDAEFMELVHQGKIKAFLDTDAYILAEVDVIVICVPTPLTKNMDPDISYIENVTYLILPYLRHGQLITLESTTYPGTTEEVVLGILQKSGYKVGEDFFLAYSPERVDPGNQRYTTKNISKVVGGVTPACLDVAVIFYSQTLHHVVPVSSTAAAELTKVFENTYRSVNIALVNELAILCDRMNINVWEVLDAAGTKPFGIQIFYPGPGVGGHCIPIDPFYLTWKAREYNFHTRFIELAGEINMSMPNFVIEKLSRELNKQIKCLNGSKILVLGASYKKDVNDVRESPAIKVMELLLSRQADMIYHDPHVPSLIINGKFLSSQELSPDLLSHVDAVVITTNHSNVNYKIVVDYAKLILDTRNALKDSRAENIVRL